MPEEVSRRAAGGRLRLPCSLMCEPVNTWRASHRTKSTRYLNASSNSNHHRRQSGRRNCSHASTNSHGLSGFGRYTYGFSGLPIDHWSGLVFLPTLLFSSLSETHCFQNTTHFLIVQSRVWKREQARRDRDRLRHQIVATTQAGRPHECVLWAGQTAGGISEILSARAIMRRLMTETEAALSRVPGVRAPPQSGRAA